MTENMKDRQKDIQRILKDLNWKGIYMLWPLLNGKFAKIDASKLIDVIEWDYER